MLFTELPPKGNNFSTVICSGIAVLAIYITRILVLSCSGYLEDKRLAKSLGCQLPPELSKKWPLGIDRIRDLWRSNSEGHLLAFLCSLASQYEPRNNLCQYLLFGPRAFHVLHPANLEVVLSTSFSDVFKPLLGHGIFTQEGMAWKHSRELLRKQFARIGYQDLVQFREHVDDLIERLPASGTVDLQPLFFSLTLDTTTALLLGRSVYSLRAGVDQDAENQSFAENFNIAQEGLAKRFRIAPWQRFYNPKSFRKACRAVHDYVEKYIETTLHSTKSSDETASTFIHHISQEAANTADIRDQLLNVLLAGRDTTACCLSWTFRLLVRHPETLWRLRQEVHAVIGSCEKISRDKLKQMSYLNCVIKESLRLYPPVPLNNRTANRTTILPTGGGPLGTSPMLVRKGELVVFSSYVNSRVKSIYGEDACVFKPERWETDELSKIGWAYFPFSRGPRQCLGEDFAMMEISYTIVRLLRATSTIALPPNEKVEPIGSEQQRLTLVLAPTDGCRVELKLTPLDQSKTAAGDGDRGGMGGSNGACT